MSINQNEIRGYVPFKCLPTRLGRLAVDDVKDLDGAVGRTRSKSFSVVVKLGVVLGKNKDEHIQDGNEYIRSCLRVRFRLGPHLWWLR